ncbi:MAG: Fe-S cluster assembly protein SufD [Propionibacteriaceae bacterium]|jgi:Fe-S cluster assembly protein SufD|nr:Fe-S cluster assembly protein SufD [Propionibacteriaceae bacterium]
MSKSVAPVDQTGSESATVVSHLHPVGSFVLADHPAPSGKEEFWRFTPLAKVQDFFDDTLERSSLDVHVEPGSGVGFGHLGLGQSPRGTVLTPVDRTSAIAAAVPQATHLVVEGTLERPVRVNIQGESLTHPTADHVVIEALPQSCGTILLNHTGAARHIGNVEIIVGEGANLTVVTLQDWAPGSVHFGQHEALVGKDAVYRHIDVSLGGSLIRLQNNLSYASIGGDAELYGVYFAQSGQHIEHRLFIDHDHPKGVSHVDYRGALQGEGAESVWVGDVLIRPTAIGIETYEANKNLVLTDGCRVHAVPNLEIETGEIVGAGHSASTGRFDDEQLFYLESRGIDETEARRLVVRGFFATILARIGIEDVEETLMRRLDAELAFDKEN